MQNILLKEVNLPIHLSLSKVEKNILYHKYVSEGMGIDKAHERLKNTEDYLEKLVLKLKKQKKSKEEINLRFRDEFEKICMRY